MSGEQVAKECPSIIEIDKVSDQVLNIEPESLKSDVDRWGDRVKDEKDTKEKEVSVDKITIDLTEQTRPSPLKDSRANLEVNADKVRVDTMEKANVDISQTDQLSVVIS
ncbi:hypothetical protein HAX54_013222 [Datura stramonium]|uniref:Uncharacterized protein n=1 Tax=Datura stramonium TaxID=4076 RepID=A0ABS8TLY3_DATST|nr:hypothetical protein [Datura stramonium]